KYIGSYLAVLNGAQAICFTGGIGENSAEIRRRICSELGFLGITIDEKKNSANEHDISSGGMTKTLVIQTNEELMIARHTADIVADKLAGMEKASSV
ncbi:MAG: acetate kinase, partial [Cyanobacteria bacterium]|nr:acetate kinase [Cyanobacteriota bacterium]